MRKSHVVVAASAVVLLAAGSVVAWKTQAPNAHSLGTNSVASAGQLAAGAGGSVADLSAGSVADASVPQSTITPAQARVVKTASLEVSVRTNALVTDATAQANHVAEANGGYVASSDSFKGKNRQTTLTLRVPAAAYDDALRELRRLGKVTDESLGGKDVTGTLVDLDARLRTLRAQEDALNALLAKARTVGETLQVTQAASEVRMQVEQLAAQQAQLSDQADFSTIKLHIVGPNVALDAVPKTDPLLVTSMRHAVAGTLAVFGGVIVVIGYLLPIAALGALGYFGRRVTSRRPIAVESPQ